MKSIYTFLLAISFLFISLNGFTQGEYVVQIAAYETPVSGDYFIEIPDEPIYYYKDHQRFYHYFIGQKYTKEADAQAAFSKAKSIYPNTIILDLKKLKECAQCCNPEGNIVIEGSLKKFKNVPPPPTIVTTYTPPPTIELPPKIEVNECNLPAFDLRNKEDYERIRTVLVNNPGSSVILRSCAKVQELGCYLSLRDASFCDIPVLSRQEIKTLFNCDNLNSCVYVIDVNNQPIDIQTEFRRIVGR